ncbi:MAG: helix-turn-helix domain-containing protein [Geminicoccaceae bacterium]|nr:helix-turn-helix domain-containing protein [Geminicoccaceae bacterium]
MIRSDVRLEHRGVVHYCNHCAVRHLSICAGLERDVLSRMSQLCAHQRIQPGVCLIEEGQPAEYVFTVVDGMVKLYKLMPDGRRQVTGFLIKGDFVGLAYGDNYIYTAEAVVPTLACRIKRSQFHNMMEDHPSLERNLLSRASTELAAAQGQMLLLGRKTARERLATFLLGLAQRLDRKEGDVVLLPMGRSDIADFLGLTVETVSRTFTAMRKDGTLARVDKAGIVIADMAQLARVAGD